MTNDERLVERLETSSARLHGRTITVEDVAGDPEQSAAARDAAITAQLNRVYRDDPGGMDPALRRIQQRSLDTSA